MNPRLCLYDKLHISWELKKKKSGVYGCIVVKNPKIVLLQTDLRYSKHNMKLGLWMEILKGRSGKKKLMKINHELEPYVSNPTKYLGLLPPPAATAEVQGNKHHSSFVNTQEEVSTDLTISIQVFAKLLFYSLSQPNKIQCNLIPCLLTLNKCTKESNFWSPVTPYYRDRYHSNVFLPDLVLQGISMRFTFFSPVTPPTLMTLVLL